VSEAITSTGSTTSTEERPAPAARRREPGRSGGLVRLVLGLVLLVVLLVAPLYLDQFWLSTGFAVFGAVVGAIGLNLLTGTTGQLSLAHAFFLGVGAITYVFVSGKPSSGSTAHYDGLQLSPVLGMVVAVLVAGLAGLIFSPIAARLRGIYLGVASIGLVFIGQHLLNTWTTVTGGFNGRTAPEFSLFGFSFGSDSPELFILNVPFGQAERHWYLGLVVALLAFLFARNLLRSRSGRALQTLRDSEVAAAVMGVNVQAYKAKVFLVSSMYAGLSGVLLALSIGSVAPESFGLDVSVQYLAMIVLGGLGSVGGAALGALFVTAIPLVFQQYAGSLPFVSEPGQGGVNAGQAARYLYGLAIILIVMFEPGGLVGLGRRFTRRQPARATGPGSSTSGTPGGTSSSAASASPSSDPTTRTTTPAQGSNA
jgi:branched-chain amino acid transport system permease protein